MDFFLSFREKPLTLYVYASDTGVQNQWKLNTSSGSLVFNECMLQLGGKFYILVLQFGDNKHTNLVTSLFDWFVVPNLPFGGVGNSGMGRYKGKASIDAFSNPRSVLDKGLSEKGNNM